MSLDMLKERSITKEWIAPRDGGLFLQIVFIFLSILLIINNILIVNHYNYHSM